MPDANGMSQRKSMLVPCVVKILWKVFGSGIMPWLPGRNNSVRIAIASAPPIIKAVKDKIT